MMADEPILGLFDSDTNFLDELTDGVGDLISSDGDGMLGQPHGLGLTTQMSSGSNPLNSVMMRQQTAQASGTAYQQMASEGYGGIGSNGSSVGHAAVSQYNSSSPIYSQYGTVPKLAAHHGENVITGNMQQQGGVSVVQQQQFASPPAGGIMHQHTSYPSYTLAAGPLPSHQQQPMGLMGQQGGINHQHSMMGQQQGMMGQQGSGWNPAQSSPTTGHTQFVCQQPQQGCLPMGQNFIGQHDLNIPQNMNNHYGDNSTYMQQQSSSLPSSSSGNPISHKPHSQFQTQPAYGLQQGQHYTNDFIAQHPSQHYSYSPSSVPATQTLASDETALSHFTSQNQPVSYMSSFPGVSHPSIATSTLSACTSQSMAGSHDIGQGSYSQSSLQELEQLVSPTLSSGGSIPSTNPYQQIMQSSGNSSSHSPSFPTTTTTSHPSSPAPTLNVALNSTGQLSPSVAMRPGAGQQAGVTLEIQRLEKQIQHLFNLPQTQQISQQMLDMQERLRILRAQQQQQIIQMQRQQHMNNAVRLAGKCSFGQQQHSSMGHQRPRMPATALSPISGMGPSPFNPQTSGQLQVQGHLLGQQISPQRPTSHSTPISSPQRIQPFQSPTSSTAGDGLSAHTPPSQSLVVQQAADQLQPTPPKPSLIDRHHESDPGKVMSVDQLPATVAEIAEAQGEKPKRKRERKPKEDKTPKIRRVPKEKKTQTPKQQKEPRAPKTPKEPKVPKTPRTPKATKIAKDAKEKKTRVRKSKKVEENEIVNCDISSTCTEIDVEKVDSTTDSSVPTTCGELDENKVNNQSDQLATPKKKAPKEKKPRTPKAVVKALRKPSSKKKKPPASLFLKKRKRKRTGSDGSDVELPGTPQPGSPVADAEASKRRSARNTKRKKYLDDLDLNLSDDDGSVLEALETSDGPVAMKTETEEDVLVVEKILGTRTRKRDAEEKMEVAELEEDEDEEEFLVKYKNYSFLHCEWRTVAEIGDKRILSKIKRYKLKKQLNAYFDEPEDEEYFNPDYVEVDRVLDMVTSKDPVTEEEVTHYLVKWRALSYEESTWELQQDVDPVKVQLFKELRVPPSEDQRQVLARPKPSHWRKLEELKLYKGDNTLREYQLEGLNWLTFCWYNGQNCILADEMGLGKTIQSITFLNEISQYGIRGPFLVIVPLSTIGNWQREFEMWTDMNAVVYHGTSNSRSMIQEYELFYKDENGQRLLETFKFHALITTYEIIIADVELLTSIEWRCCIIDEAHRLKNKNCRLLEGLRLFDIEHRVLLTGTPLQNNTEELFSLLNFLDPGKFSSCTAFSKEFGDLKTEAQVDRLKEILKPMMLRRLKEDVEKNLAPKEETIIEVELTNIQKKYYRAILERNFQFLSKGGTTNMPSLMNTMMELRKCCNHPYLINGAEEQIVNEQGARGDNEQLLAALVGSSGKMVLMDKLLPRLKQDGHKVLIFSQMIRVLDIIEDYLVQKKYLFERLDGRIRGNLRQEAIDRFSKPDSDRFVFLLCTRAGGLGINLTAADTVVIYDSDWNPQNDLQAQARCHRIGQSKAVKVYRLITRNSYEREMFDKASLKLGLDKAVLQSMGGDKPINPASQLSKKEVEDLLKKGAYGALMEDDSAGDKFCEEDIDLILQRRTKVIQIESEGKGSTFAKASFSVSDNRTDIDINDPNFWQKWAKKADIDVNTIVNKNELIIQEPRQRRQTSRYGKEEAVMDISDLESSTDSDDEIKLLRRGRKTRRNGRGNDEDFMYNDGISSEGYTRSDCFKVEKHLLIYGWGRWQDIIRHAHFKHLLVESDVQIIARAILAHSLKFYKGDERIKEFIWDLIAKTNEGELKNHTGLSAPVPRGRKGKKAKEKKAALEEGRSLDFNPEAVLDNGYKRHLHRHSNKVLLRVRLLYYIKQEVIGDEAAKVFQGAKCHEVDIPQPITDGEVPAPWWDECADRCLLIGVFKHGYEKFNQVRQDPALCFLARCGPPDGAALLAEQNDENREEEEELEDKLMKEDEEGELSQSSAPDTIVSCQPISVQTDESGEVKFVFPSGSDLNVRLRRVITGYQRNHKKMMLKQEQFARKMERREQAQMLVSERVSKKREFQQSRWSRREEADFYRTVSTFGVEFDRESGRFKWDRFRSLARLDRKCDENITEYFHAFYYMCQTVCGKFRSDDRVPPPPNGIFVEPITEERASRCLARIDLLNKIRDDILPHPKLVERLKLCQPSFDMPPWWQCGKHDKELLLGAARHGVARTDYNILRDPSLTFHEVLKNSSRHLRSTHHHSQLPVSSPVGATSHLMSAAHIADFQEDDIESDCKSQDSMDLPDRPTCSSPTLQNGQEQYSKHHLSANVHLEDAAELDGAAAFEKNVRVDSSPVHVVQSVRADRSPVHIEQSVTADSSPVHIEQSVTADSSPVHVVLSVTADSSPVHLVQTAERTQSVSSSSTCDFQDVNSIKHNSKDSLSEDNEERVCVGNKSREAVGEKEVEICSTRSAQDTDGINLKHAIEMGNPDKQNFFKEKTEKAVLDSESDDKCAVLSPKNEQVENIGIENNKTRLSPKVSCRIVTNLKNESESMKDEETASHEMSDGLQVRSEFAAVNQECNMVNSGDSTLGKSEDKGDKPDYVKLKERIIQGEIDRLHREKMAREELVNTAAAMDDLTAVSPAFSGLYGEEYMETENLEPGEIVPGRPFLGPAIEWPKDRVIFHRLEHICYTVEHGEWPFTRRQSSFVQITPYESCSTTPVGSSTPRPDSASESGEAVDLNQVIHPLGGEQGEKDFEVHLSQNEGLKMTFHKRSRGRGRGGSSHYEIDMEKAARVQQLLNQSAQTMGSSDSEGQPEPRNLSTPLASVSRQSSPSISTTISGSFAESPLNGSPISDIEQFHQSMERRRRGRRRKAEKMAEQAMAEALAKREQARILASLDPEARVPVINIEDGSVLSGDEAPRKEQLEQWLLDHPGYMISGQAASIFPFSLAQLDEPVMSPMHQLQRDQLPQRRKPGRKPKLDPRMLHAQLLTGEENVSVIERGSGRKITGAKAPPLKHLKEWLEQNPTFDVDPKWGELLRAKGSLPASMDTRLLKPSGRGRKPRSSSTLHSMMSSQDFPLHGAIAGFPETAGLMATSFPKMHMTMPFANLAGLGMANPMLGLATTGFPLASFPVPCSEGEESQELKDKVPSLSTVTTTNTCHKSETITTSTSASPHPSFGGFFFNPMAFNPLLSGQLSNFALPTFPAISHMASLNGLSDSAGLLEEQVTTVRKEKKSKAEKCYDNGKDMCRAEVLTAPVKSVRSVAQDLTKSKRDSSPSPAHSKGNKSSSSTNITSSQDQATDLSIKPKPHLSSALTASATTESKFKNKIHKSFSLNKIVDSLKEKIEEKSKKKDEDVVKENTEVTGCGESNRDRCTALVVVKPQSKVVDENSTGVMSEIGTAVAIVKPQSEIVDENIIGVTSGVGIQSEIVDEIRPQEQCNILDADVNNKSLPESEEAHSSSPQPEILKQANKSVQQATSPQNHTQRQEANETEESVCREEEKKCER